jgi:hypothetical protein
MPAVSARNLLKGKTQFCKEMKEVNDDQLGLALLLCIGGLPKKQQTMSNETGSKTANISPRSIVSQNTHSKAIKMTKSKKNVSFNLCVEVVWISSPKHKDALTCQM